MGLFDGALGNLVNSAQNQAQSNKALLAVMALVQEQGGLPKVLAMFNQNGLTQEARSWVGNEANLPILAEHIQRVFSAEALQGVASKLGVSMDEACGVIAKILPTLVNHLTPDGSVPQNHEDLLSQGLSMLKGNTPLI